MSFNYDESPDVDFSVVEQIVTELSGPRTRPLSAEEREALQITHNRWLAQCRERDRQQRAEYERRQAEAAAVERAEAIHRASVARDEERKRISAEFLERSRSRTRDQTLTGLLNHAIEQRQYRESFTRSARLASSRQRLSAALGDAVAFKNPPPLPEPNIVVVERGEDEEKFCGVKIPRWR